MYENEINLYLDFDKTQVKGHLHNAVIGALISNHFPVHPEPPKVYKYNELLDILKDQKKEMPKEVTDWLDNIIEKQGIKFFNPELLRQKLKQYKDRGIQIKY